MNSSSVIIGKSLEKTWSVHDMIYFKSKRAFDVLVGFLGILLILPLAVLIKIAFLLTGDHNKVLIKQNRIGKDGKIFGMYKFQTMVADADERLYELLETDESFRKEYELNKKVKNDPRVTKVGKFLRATSLDEVPQFINVFLGQMSLVGNRPYLPREKNDMGVYYRYIVSSKPGITGLWQTSGRSNTTFHERLMIEKRYSGHQGLILDTKIIIKTIAQVLKKEGAV
jgi:undecaprenyl-phosphate galactose phosphotransferase